MTERPRKLMPAILQAFMRPPDSAGILQGVRPFRKGRSHARIVLFPSQKNDGRTIACEGRLEADAALCLELHPKVDAYRGQGLEMPGPHNRNIVPDFVVRMGRYYAVLDIKPFGQLARPAVIERMQFIRKKLAKVGVPHYILTERDLHKQPHLQIREQLRSGLTVDLEKPEQDVLIEHVSDKTISVRNLRTYAVKQGLSPFSVEKLAIDGQLTFPITSPWQETTLIGAHNDEHSTTTSHWGTVYDLQFTL